jgi:hypothetical protein
MSYSSCNLTKKIDENECIGDSLTTINANFSALEVATCNLYSKIGFIIKNSNYTAVNGDKIAADTSAGSFTITLPSSPSSADSITIVDAAGTWDTNNLTIARNGQTIEGLSQDLTCETEGDMAITLFFNGTTWKVYL